MSTITIRFRFDVVTLFVFKPECFCLLQGGDNNAEGSSPTNLLAGDDDAQSKILGLRRESLHTDGLDLAWTFVYGSSLELVLLCLSGINSV